MKVISVSRRTDIPAFYSEWFMNRVRAGCVRWVNPFSKAEYNVSLRPEDVVALIFWSKNHVPLLPHLDELDGRGYRMLFHFTITGLPKVFEPRVPTAEDMVQCAQVLSERYAPDAVLWRYDPVLMSSITDHQYHLRRFAQLCAALEGAVRRCYFSFPMFYRKVTTTFEVLRKQTGITCWDLPVADRIELAEGLADIASAHGIEMLSCCGDYLVGGKIKKAHCVDAELLCRLYPDKVHRLRETPTRDACGCCECTDIGASDTCPHGCVYCYANSRVQTALRNHGQHDPCGDVIIEDGRSHRTRGGELQLDLDP